MEPDIKPINDLAWSCRASRTLQVANGLDIFTLLAEAPATTAELAEKCSAEPALTEKLLIACQAMGLIQRRDGRYHNTPLAQTYLVRTSLLYQGDIIAHSASVWDFWSDLPNTIRQKNAPPPACPDQHHNFIMGMQNIARTGRAQLLLDNIDLTGREKLFDVGGGPGTYSIELCRKYPQLKATIFDLPETIAITNQIIVKEDIQNRITCQAGNWDTDSFGSDNDVVLLSNVLHGPQSSAEMKLQKAFDSMTQQGLLIIQEFILNDDRSGPLIPALFNIMVGAYSRKELTAVIENAGFTNCATIAESEQFDATWLTAKKP